MKIKSIIIIIVTALAFVGCGEEEEVQPIADFSSITIQDETITFQEGAFELRQDDGTTIIDQIVGTAQIGSYTFTGNLQATITPRIYQGSRSITLTAIINGNQFTMTDGILLEPNDYGLSTVVFGGSFVNSNESVDVSGRIVAKQ